MATQTQNYGFNLDAETDYYDIENLNENLTLIDNTIKTVEDKATANKFQTPGGTATAITLSDLVLEDGNSKTFIVKSNNSGAETTINGKLLYKPGTVQSPKLIAGKAITVWYDLTGDCFFIKASAEGTAVADNVLAGKTFSNDDDTGIGGSMTYNGPESSETVNLTVQNQEYTIAKGFHSGLKKIKAVISGLVAGVIKAGTTVGGILGTFTSDATAAAGDILSGKTGYVNGNKITGTMADRSGDTTASSLTRSGTTIKLKATQGYRDGTNDYVTHTDANDIAGNIKSGVTIRGQTGTCIEATGNAVAANVLSGKTFSKAGSAGLTGTIPSKSAATYTPSQSAQTISSGQYLSGAQTISAVSFDATKVLTGTTIAGKAGTMPNRGSQTATLNITDSTKPTKTISAGYTTGGTITAQIDPSQAANIRQNVNLAGCVGTLEEGYYVKTGKRTMDYNTTYVVTAPTGFRAVHAYSLLGTFSDVLNRVDRFAVKSVSPLHSIDIGAYSGRIAFNESKVTFYNHFDNEYDMLWGAIFTPE